MQMPWVASWRFGWFAGLGQPAINRAARIRPHPSDWRPHERNCVTSVRRARTEKVALYESSCPGTLKFEMCETCHLVGRYSQSPTSLVSAQAHVGVFDRRPTNTVTRRSVLEESDMDARTTPSPRRVIRAISNQRRGLRPPTYNIFEH